MKEYDLTSLQAVEFPTEVYETCQGHVQILDELRDALESLARV